MTTSVRSSRDRIAASVGAPGVGADFVDPLVQAIHDVVGHDGFVLLGFDPDSGLRSFMASRDGIGEPRRYTHNEWKENDVNRYVDLAVADVPVGVLHDSSRKVVSSPRLHEILRPGGIHAELRLALRDRSRLWGALVLYRSDPHDRFTDQDVRRILDLADPLREAVIRHPMRHQEVTRTDTPAGVIVLDRDDEVVSMTTEARAWLSEALTGGLGEEVPGRIHRAVYEVARVARDPHAPTRPPTARLRSGSGRWIAITASQLDGTTGHVAVVLQQASLGQMLPAAAAWFRLTQRETDVLRLASHGGSARSVARSLRLSQYTVNDHLTSIYRKAGVRGRDGLLDLIT